DAERVDAEAEAHARAAAHREVVEDDALSRIALADAREPDPRLLRAVDDDDRGVVGRAETGGGVVHEETEGRRPVDRDLAGGREGGAVARVEATSRGTEGEVLLGAGDGDVAERRLDAHQRRADHVVV